MNKKDPNDRFNGLSTAQWQALDANAYMHPFTNYKERRKKGSRIITRAEGCYIWDSEGRCYLDGMAGLCTTQIGYGPREIAEMAASQILELSYYNSVFDTSNKPAIRLAEKLLALAPEEMSRVFFTNSGSEANDTAIRMVRHYWRLCGKPEKRALVALESGYHGSTTATARLSGNPAMHAQGAALDEVYHIQSPYKFMWGRTLDDESFGVMAAQWFEEEIYRIGAHKIAAFWAEPFQSFGGGRIPPKAYWREVQSLCKKHDILLVIDEVVSGFGRTGYWFGAEYFDITDADVICAAKGMSSGYVPIGAAIVGERIANAFIEYDDVFVHGFTYSGHPVCCAIALENIRILEDEAVITNVRTSLAPYLKSIASKLAAHEVIGEVRTCGLMAAFELVKDKNTLERITPAGHAAEFVAAATLKRGVIVRALGETIVILPPLIITRAQLNELIASLSSALDDLAAHLTEGKEAPG